MRGGWTHYHQEPDNLNYTVLNELYLMFYCRRRDDVTFQRLGLTCMKASLLWFSLHNILRFLSGVGTAHAMQFLSTSFETAVHHWFTCIRDVFFKNFTSVWWMLHPQACRLLLFVASPMGISESFRVNMSLSETVAPSKTDQNISTHLNVHTSDSLWNIHICAHTNIWQVTVKALQLALYYARWINLYKLHAVFLFS